ncbi:MAG: ZIP family metal transporter [Deltaproteobacteria bacterium]|nr:ZIP family metal transporter [Deltaproteobacteria bacterium]
MTGSFLPNLLFSSGVLSVAVALGGILPIFFHGIRKHLPLFLSCSAGIMLGATLLHLLPEAVHLIGPRASWWLLLGFLFLYLFERFVTVHICEALDCEVHTMGIAAVVGISAHALTDGVALGAGLLLSKVGWVVLITIFFHKLPEAFALTSILLHETKRRFHILLMNLVLILMVPLGGFLLYYFMRTPQAQSTGAALAFSAGTFLHIAISGSGPSLSGRRCPIPAT